MVSTYSLVMPHPKLTNDDISVFFFIFFSSMHFFLISCKNYTDYAACIKYSLSWGEKRTYSFPNIIYLIINYLKRETKKRCSWGQTIISKVIVKILLIIWGIILIYSPVVQNWELNSTLLTCCSNKNVLVMSFVQGNKLATTITHPLLPLGSSGRRCGG